ncbi:MAG: outer membrane beta-barrel protein [Thermodesulfobacteriota bacterium]
MLAALAASVLLWVLSCLLGLSSATPAQAGVITPYISASVGYTDNVRFSRVAHSDGFFRVTPGVRVHAGQKPHELDAFADVSFIQYFRLTDLSNFDGGNLGVNYTYTPSPRFQFYARARGTSSYDQTELSDQGSLITVGSGQGRTDRIGITLGSKYRYGPFDSVEVGVGASRTTNTDPTQEDSTYEEAYLIWTQRVAVVYETIVRLHFDHTTYDVTPTTDTGRAEFELGRYLGPTRRGFVSLAFNVSRAQSDDSNLTSGRDYEIVTVTVGFSHRVTPRFKWEGSVGWAQVYGNSTYNDAANNGFPVFDFRASYKGPTWDAMAYTRADLSEFDSLGDNSGLTVNHRVGFNFRYRFTPHWSAYANAEYALNNYQENPAITQTSQRGRVHNYLIDAGISWQIARNWRLSLDYHHVTRDAEETDDDRSENRVMLTLYTEYPYRW